MSMSEHDDDLEPEVSDGAEIETENYADLAEDVEEQESEEKLPDVEVEEDEGEAPDTI
jgi:hypothetical protein